jgi:hypothetical protein
MSPPVPIRLRAADAEDLAVIAACLQDAIASLAEMRYERAEQRFALVVERFLWEEAPNRSAGAGLRARRCGLHFEGVRSVRVRGLDQQRPTQVLELLTVMWEESGERGERGERCTVSLMFAGGGEIRLETSGLGCYLMDLDAPRRTRLRPRHGLAEGAAT